MTTTKPTAIYLSLRYSRLRWLALGDGEQKETPRATFAFLSSLSLRASAFASSLGIVSLKRTTRPLGTSVVKKILLNNQPVKSLIKALPWLEFKWRNIFTYPRVSYSAVLGETGDSEINIEGVVCGLCAMRARQAIAGLEEVRDAQVDFHRQKVRVSLAQGTSTEDFLLRAARAVDTVVVARPVRRILHNLSETILKNNGKG